MNRDNPNNNKKEQIFENIWRSTFNFISENSNFTLNSTELEPDAFLLEEIAALFGVIAKVSKQLNLDRVFERVLV